MRLEFVGVFLPQKSDLEPPIETQRVSVQQRVLSYSVENAEISLYRTHLQRLYEAVIIIWKELFEYSRLTVGFRTRHV